jgi:hypothetical protein
MGSAVVLFTCRAPFSKEFQLSTRAVLEVHGAVHNAELTLELLDQVAVQLAVDLHVMTRLQVAALVLGAAHACAEHTTHVVLELRADVAQRVDCVCQGGGRQHHVTGVMKMATRTNMVEVVRPAIDADGPLTAALDLLPTM